MGGGFQAALCLCVLLVLALDQQGADAQGTSGSLGSTLSSLRLRISSSEAGESLSAVSASRTQPSTSIRGSYASSVLSTRYTGAVPLGIDGRYQPTNPSLLEHFAPKAGIWSRVPAAGAGAAEGAAQAPPFSATRPYTNTFAPPMPFIGYPAGYTLMYVPFYSPYYLGFNWIVYDNQNLFYGYDLEDASDHGYDYESDDLPAGCHFQDDDGGDKPLAPAPAPASRPTRQGLCSQRTSTVSNDTLAEEDATLEDYTMCRGLVCYPVAARVKANEQDIPFISGAIAAIFSIVGAGLAAGLMIWQCRAIASQRRRPLPKIC